MNAIEKTVFAGMARSYRCTSMYYAGSTHVGAGHAREERACESSIRSPWMVKAIEKKLLVVIL
jgi:hypothetical protein